MNLNCNKYLSLALFLIIGLTTAFASNEKRIKGLKGKTELVVGNEIFLQDYLFQQMLLNPQSYQNDFYQKHAKVKVVLRDEDNELFNYSDWTIRLGYRLELRDQHNNLYTKKGHLFIDGKTQQSYKEKNIVIYDDKKYHSAKLIIDFISYPASAPNNVRLDLILDIERYHVLHSKSPAIEIADNPSGNSWYGLTKNPVKEFLNIKWNYIKGAEFYELDWIFLDFPETPSNFPNNQFPKPNTPITEADLIIDWKQASRVKLKKQFYQLRLNYTRGYLLYRVRAVGYDIHGNRQMSDWSIQAQNSDLSSVSTATHMFIGFAGRMRDKNWNSITVYAEDGLKKESMSFYDGANRNRQSNTTLESQSTKIVSQAIFDKQGRKTINALPSVIYGNSSDYQNDIYKNNSNQVYSWEHFDTKATLYAPDSMSAIYSTGAPKYYSPLNNMSFENKKILPQSEGYPFTRTQLSNDGLSRVIRQSGIGKKMKIGSTQNTQFIYTAPAGSQELDRLFGSELGTTGYTKEIIVDPNGQKVFNYYDMDRNLIANSIFTKVLDNSKNLKNLDGNHSGYSKMISSPYRSDLLTNSNVLSDITWESQSVYAPDEDNTFLFDYTILTSAYNVLFCDTPIFTPSLEYLFNVNIRIFDELGIPVEMEYLGAQVNEIEINALSNDSLRFKSDFKFGKTYYISKKLILDTAYISSELKDALLNTNLPCDVFGFDSDTTKPMLIVGCAMECMNDNGYKPVYSPKGSVLYYSDPSTGATVSLDNSIHLACENYDCDSISVIGDIKTSCEVKKTNMISAMSTDGSYYDNTAHYGTASYQPNSWLNTHYPNHSFLSGNGVSSWGDFKQMLQTYTNNGDTLLGTSYANVNPNFTWNHQTSWEQLMPLHPEYKIYSERCIEERTEPQAYGSNLLYDRIHKGDFDRFQHFFFKTTNDSLALLNGLFNPIGRTSIPIIENQLSGLPIDTNQYAYTITFNEAQNNGFGFSGTYPTDYLIDTFLLYGFEFVDNTTGNTVARFPVDLDSLTYKFLNYLNNITEVNGIPISVWDILSKSFEMSGNTAFNGLSSINSNMIDSNVNMYLYAMLGPQGQLHPNNITPLSRILYFQSQYHFFREMTWYKIVKDRSNTVFGIDSFYFQMQAHDPYELVFPEESIYEDFLAGNGSQITISNLPDSFQMCTSLAKSWAEATVTSFRYHTLPTGLFDEFNDYQDLLNTMPVTNQSLADQYAYADSILILRLTSEAINCQCNEYGGLTPTNFLVNPIQSDTFNIKIEAIGSSDSSFTISHLTNSASKTINSFVFPFNMPISSVMAYPQLSPSELKTCSCNEYLDFITDAGLTNDQQIANELLNSGLIDSLSQYDPQWKVYCDMGQMNTLEYLFISKFPKQFYCIQGPMLAGYKQQYNSAYNTYLTNFQIWEQDSVFIIDSLIGVTADSLFDVALNEVEEHLYMHIPPGPFHHTLYYYDQAKNLIKTVPPKGVDDIYDFAAIDQARENPLNPIIYPNQEYISNYDYNTLNQITKKSTPDGGTTQYWYDELNRLILSKKSNGQYAYTVYDNLSRIVETGVIAEVLTPFNSAYHASTKPITLGISIGNQHNYYFLTPFYLWIQSNRLKERTQIHYDQSFTTGISNLFTSGQKNLRMRVASSTVKESDELGSIVSMSFTTALSNLQSNSNASVNNTINILKNGLLIHNYENATHYSYDIHGNVSELIQSIHDDFSSLDIHKKLIYKYDLLSGNVNQVVFQPGEEDQFAHRYFYDEDNRLVEVETSPSLEDWETQAKYFYYPHGPLSRVELGAKQVQANDYAYTLHGWLKAINNANKIKEDDPAADGIVNLSNKHRTFAQNAFGFNLNYYKEDYQSIGDAQNKHIIRFNHSNMGTYTKHTDLYNGNISQMVTGIASMDVQGNQYVYDQLNRIIESRVFTPSHSNLVAYNPIDIGSISDKWQTTHEYDPNGNITKLQRNKNSNILMDDMTYKYYEGSAAIFGRNTNRLRLVKDQAPNDPSIDDFEDNGFVGQNVFDYDSIGNLTRNKIDEIYQMHWLANGKVSEIVRDNGSKQVDLKFGYDSSGNRIWKLIKKKDASGNLKPPSEWEKIVYLRDAQGNVMSTYTLNNTGDIDQKEFHLYGSNRLGIFKPNTSGLGNSNSKKQAVYKGLTQFELSNHLGNVLTVVSDRKLSSSSAGNTEYKPQILSYNDYYPFGMQMPGRKSNPENYRFGFNGKENDNEIKGNGNSIDFGARMYDSRLGRWFASDPLEHKYPSLSTYSFVGNMPIIAIDPDGMRIKFTQDATVDFKNKTLALLQKLTNDELKIINNEIVITKKGIANPNKDLLFGSFIISEAIKSSNTVTIKSQSSALYYCVPSEINKFPADVIIGFNPYKRASNKLRHTKGGYYWSATDKTMEFGLIHELIHTIFNYFDSKGGQLEDKYSGWDQDDPDDNDFGKKSPIEGQKEWLDSDEVFVRIFENIIRDEHKVDNRVINLNKTKKNDVKKEYGNEAKASRSSGNKTKKKNKKKKFRYRNNRYLHDNN